MRVLSAHVYLLKKPLAPKCQAQTTKLPLCIFGARSDHHQGSHFFPNDQVQNEFSLSLRSNKFVVLAVYEIITRIEAQW